MNPLSRLSLLLRFASVLLLVPNTQTVVAQDIPLAEPCGDTELVISDGTFSRGGKQQPATIRNLVDVITARYPRVNITLVGVEDVLIENMTLRWGKRVPQSGNDLAEPPLQGILAALRAASGQRFSIEAFGSGAFLLSGPPRAASRYAEVFNLGPLLANHRAKQLERRLREAETELAAVQKVMGWENPRIAGLKTEIEILKATAAQAGPPPEATKIIEQVKAAVILTLGQLSSREKPPEFSYHPGTNLLIVVGGEEAIETTRKVVAALEKGGN